ncbi:uncharacterized protein LOC143191375 isoform X2 [Rhynchophorus ferrugineus]|uniref:uncharacterized protein LOC143191375 isoform X2 n=1 Tax=Rhynchophorus ferrugineus TaxID=354439 RepID=UPI003FCC43A0
MRCITCKRTVEKGCNIFEEFGEEQATVKDDLEEILGSEVIDHLHPDDRVCGKCKIMLDDFANIRRILVEVVLNKSQFRNINYGRYWEFINRSTPGYLNGLVSQYPEYNGDIRIDRYHRKRAPSARSIASANADLANAEVARLMHRPRGRPKSVPNYKNNEVTPGGLRRVRSENAFHDNEKDLDYKLPELKFDEKGRLKNIKTRAISRHAEFYCPHCMEYEYNVGKYTSHMVKEHGYQAYYECDTCNTNYLTKAHLKMHQRIHDNSFPICPICGKRQLNIDDLQDHTSRHIAYSIPCLHCDLAFLSKKEYHEHISLEHKGKKRKIEVKKQHRVLDHVLYLDAKDKRVKEIPGSIKDNSINILIERKPTFKAKKNLDLSLNRRNLTPTFEPFWTSLGDDLYAIEKDCENNEDSDNNQDISPTYRNASYDNLDQSLNSDTSESEVDLGGARASVRKSCQNGNTTKCLPKCCTDDESQSSTEVGLHQQFTTDTSIESNVSDVHNHKDAEIQQITPTKHVTGEEWLQTNRIQTPNSHTSIDSEISESPS